MNALVSILMPAYNCEKYIQKAIDSILAQTYPHFELLIADDGSTDRTKDIIDSYQDERIKRFHHDENMGYLKASNKLVSYAKGDYITFQDADDYSSHIRLDDLLNEFRLDKALYAVGSNAYRVDILDNIIDELTFKNSYSDILSDLPHYFNCIGSALMVKKEVVQKLGLYNVFFDRVGSEDLYWYGLMAYNFKVKNSSKCLYYYRQTPNSITNQKNVSAKKLISVDFVKYFLNYYKNNKTEIFSRQNNFKTLEYFLLGKANCWQKKYKIGIAYLLKSIFLNPFLYKEKYTTLKIYSLKYFSKN